MQYLLKSDGFKLELQYDNVKLPKLAVEEKIVKITMPNRYKKVDTSDIVGILLETDVISPSVSPVVLLKPSLILVL